MDHMKSYLGDGVYVDWDGYALILATENGITTTNRIVLEPEVFRALVAYAQRIHEAHKESER